MLLLRIIAAMLSIALTLGAERALAQEYPNKPIRIVTGGAGGISDFVARLIAQGISGPVGQSVIVDNRAGASGIIASQAVANAQPDGYTLLLDAATFWIGPLLQSAPYDVIRDFSAVTLTDRSPNILVVNISASTKSVKDLIALAKSKPGELNYAAASTGSAPHLAAELFKSMAGVNVVRVTYKGAAPALTGLMGGEVQMMFPNAASVTPHIKAGRLNALAVTSAQPSVIFPALPTIAASGLPGYEAVGLQGMFVPVKTPATVINRLNQELVRVLSAPDTKEKMFNVGVEAVGTTPEQSVAAIKSDIIRWGKLIKDAGIKVD